jgi:hypothetical protein
MDFRQRASPPSYRTRRDERVLIACERGDDRAHGALLGLAKAVLQQYSNDDGQLCQAYDTSVFAPPTQLSLFSASELRAPSDQVKYQTKTRVETEESPRS